jgi:hypothetical protein
MGFGGVMAACRPKGTLAVDPLAAVNAYLKLRLDFDDVSTLFQETDGTSPVTTAGHSIKRINNKGTLGGFFSQATGTAAPTFGTFLAAQNGAIFDGSDVLVYTGDASAFNWLHNGNRHVLMFDMIYNSVVGARVLFATYGASGNGMQVFTNGGTYNKRIRSTAGLVISRDSAHAPTTATRYVYTERYQYDITGDDWTVRVNGTQSNQADSTGAPDAGNSAIAMRIGEQGTLFTSANIRRIWGWDLPNDYPDDFIALAEAAIVL